MSEITVNPNIEELQVLHEPTGKWVQATMVLQRVGGFEVKIPDELLAVLQRIESNAIDAADYGDKFDSLQAAILAVEQAIANIELTVEGDSNGGINRDQLVDALSPLSSQTTAIDSSLNSIDTKLVNLFQAVSQISAGISSLNKRKSVEVLEEILNFENSVDVQEILLPSTTESLIFMPRRANDGEYPEVRYSFRDPSLNSYRTLPPGAEYNKVGLNWDGKRLFAKPDKNCIIEVTAYYAQ